MLIPAGAVFRINMSYKPLHVVERAGLYLTVFLTGAAVMVIELLGTRMIAPFYGVTCMYERP